MAPFHSMLKKSKKVPSPDKNERDKKYCGEIGQYAGNSPSGIKDHGFSASISRTKDTLFTVSSAHAGKNPQRSALRTERIFDHAAQ